MGMVLGYRYVLNSWVAFELLWTKSNNWFVFLFFLAVQLLAQLSFFILGAKVRSRALLFIYRLFFQLVYHVFYRNLVRPSPPRLSL